MPRRGEWLQIWLATDRGTVPRKRLLPPGPPRLCRNSVRSVTVRRIESRGAGVEGKIAIIEAVEQDVENEVHFALILEDDPGKDLGLMRQPGHRFFYSADEVEPV